MKNGFIIRIENEIHRYTEYSLDLQSIICFIAFKHTLSGKNSDKLNIKNIVNNSTNQNQNLSFMREYTICLKDKVKENHRKYFDCGTIL